MQVLDKWLVLAGSVVLIKGTQEYEDYQRFKATQLRSPDLLERVALTLPRSGVRGDLVPAGVTAADFGGRPLSREGRRWRLYWVRAGKIDKTVVRWHPAGFAPDCRLPAEEYGNAYPYLHEGYAGTMVEFIGPGEEIWEEERREAEKRARRPKNRMSTTPYKVLRSRPGPLIRIVDFMGFYRMAEEDDVVYHPSLYYWDERANSDAWPDADVVQLYLVG